MVCFILDTRAIAWSISVFIRMWKKKVEAQYVSFVWAFSLDFVFVVSGFLRSKAFFVGACCECLHYFRLSLCFSLFYKKESLGGFFIDSVYFFLYLFIFFEFLYFTLELKET